METEGRDSIWLALGVVVLLVSFFGSRADLPVTDHDVIALVTGAAIADYDTESEAAARVRTHYFIVQLPRGKRIDTAIEDLADAQKVSLRPLITGHHRNSKAFQKSGLDTFYIAQLQEPSEQHLQRALDAFQATPSLKAWEDRVVFTANVPNDPLYEDSSDYDQWSLHEYDGTQSYHPTNLPEVWDTFTDCSPTLIGVIDTGADLDHSDLKANLWTNPGEIPNNNKDDDGNGYVDDVNGWDFWNNDNTPDDDNGHGTHTSGIIAAVSDNTNHVAGVCWKAQVLPVKALDSYGAGTWSSIAQAIVYAADQGARVQSYSIGGQGGDPTLLAAVDYAASLDVVQVAAAGNQALEIDFYPAAYPNVIGVMATDQKDKRALWSNYGDWYDLAASGSDILSLWKNDATNYASGTSMATPHVSGIAAIARTINPQLDKYDTEYAILYTTWDLGIAGRDSTYQWGIPHAKRAYDTARGLTASTLTVAPKNSLDFFIEAPAQEAGKDYILLFSLAGREPGTEYFDEFGNPHQLPLTFDGYTNLLITGKLKAICPLCIGQLDSTGKATVTFTVPNKIFNGKDLFFVAAVLDETDKAAVDFATTSLRVHVT